MPQNPEPDTRLVTFPSAGGEVQFTVNGDKDTIWGTRQEIAAAFGCTEDNVRKHIRKIYEDKELDEDSTSEKNSEVQTEGGRSVKRGVDSYNLDVILAVGFRVSTKQATTFRRWANQTLKEFITVGYVLNHARLAGDAAAQQQLAEALRAIRIEERSMYAKVRDVFKESSSDYNPKSQAAQSFFAMAQDKFHYAITGKTASELVLERADASKQNMGLRTVKGDTPTAGEARTGKNYLSADELRGLENICEQFILFAESKAMRGKRMFMEELSHKLNGLLEVNEYPVLYEYKSYLKARADSHARLELDRYHARIGPAKRTKQIAGPPGNSKK